MQAVHLDDQQYLVGHEAVTVTFANDDTVALTNAVRYPISVREVQASFGAYRLGDINWTVRTDDLDSHLPAPGDRILDAAGYTHTALEAKQSAVANFHVYVTRNLALSDGLTDTVDLELPTITRDDAGGRSESWAASVPGLVCRVQPAQRVEFAERDVRSTQVEYDVIVAQQVTPINGNGDWGRLKWGSVYLEITGYQQSERIDVLPVIKCRRTP